MALAGSAATVIRISFTGELGYEIYGSADGQTVLWGALFHHGAELGLVPAGTRGLMSLRLEKSFPSWGLELAADYTPMEPELGRFIDWDNANFIGRDAALAARELGPAERFMALSVAAEEVDAWGGEPVFRDGDYVGYVTSGGFGYRIGESLALGYVHPDAYEIGAGVEVEINGVRRAARIIARSPYGPDGERMRD